jgi:hypothetical protein
MRRAVISAVTALLLLPRVGAAPIPRDDTPTNLIGRWQLVGCDRGVTKPRPNIMFSGPQLRCDLEFRANNTLRMRFGIHVDLFGVPEPENDPTIRHGTFGVRCGVISAAYRGPQKEETMSILELTGNDLVVQYADGRVAWWSRVRDDRR